MIFTKFFGKLLIKLFQSLKTFISIAPTRCLFAEGYYAAECECKNALYCDGSRHFGSNRRTCQVTHAGNTAQPAVVRLQLLNLMFKFESAVSNFWCIKKEKIGALSKDFFIVWIDYSVCSKKWRLH